VTKVHRPGLNTTRFEMVRPRPDRPRPVLPVCEEARLRGDHDSHGEFHAEARPHGAEPGLAEHRGGMAAATAAAAGAAGARR
jgi:hypothetical protein